MGHTNIPNSIGTVFGRIQELERELEGLRLEERTREHQLEVLRESLRQRTDELSDARDALERREKMLDSLVDQVVDDAVERQRIERALAENETRFRRLVDSNIIGVAVSDATGRVDFANDAYLDLVGATRDDLEAGVLNWRQYTAPESLELVSAAGAEVERRGVCVPFEKDYVLADGARKTVLIGIARLDEVGERNIVYAIDVTSRKLVEEDLRQTARELERSNRDLQQFAYIASHDLQEPLRIVVGFLRLLEQSLSGRLGEDDARYLRNAQEGTVRMQALIEGLLACARAGSGVAGSGTSDAMQALRHALANLEKAVQESGARVRWGHLPQVGLPEFELVQVFQNLIGNAIKFRGEVAPRVRVSARCRGAEWVFAVRDNGLGVADENRSRIFELFERVPRQGAAAGAGFGLAICKRIVERRGGRIWVEAARPQGSVFYFTIPVATWETPATTAVGGAPAPRGAPARRGPRPDEPRGPRPGSRPSAPRAAG